MTAALPLGTRDADLRLALRARLKGEQPDSVSGGEVNLERAP